MYSKYFEGSLWIMVMSYIAISEAFSTGHTRTICHVKHSTRHFSGSCAHKDIDGISLNENLQTSVNTNRRRMISQSLKSFAGLSIGLSGGKMKEASAAYNNRLGGLPNKIRGISLVMDELQRDLMQEKWDMVETYPSQLRSFVPLFTTYTDTAFPTDEPTDYSLRVALKYEVGRFFAALERLRKATARRSLNEAYMAYSEMAIHFDRYLHAGNLYTYEDNVVDYSKFYAGIKDTALVFADPIKDPAEVRDLIVLVTGPDKGRTGILIGIYPDGSNNCVVKLDKYKKDSQIREIRIVSRKLVGKRLGEQDPDDVFLLPQRKFKVENSGRL